MAAYAALVSVMQIIEQLEHHPLPPISLDKKQAESLTKNVTFLQDFLENYPSIGNNELESRILDAANAAEDVIESYIVDCIHARFISERDQSAFLEKKSSIEEDVIETHIVDCIEAGSTSQADEVEFGQRLQKVIEDMDLIKNEVMETKEKMAAQHQQQMKSTSSTSGQASSSRGQKQNTTMVGFDDALFEILDKLTRGGRGRQITPVVGMGGIGKTTLARNVYEHPVIKEHFYILAWATISQEYAAENILEEILAQAKKDKENPTETNEKQIEDTENTETNEKQIGDELYKYLFGRKYLIVMDDMWNIEAWDKVKFFFPDNNNGSRIVVTTRLSNLARQLSNSYGLDMRFLNFDESWDLFSKIVFPKDDFPSEMVKIGKAIVENCRGLPLSIVVVGGFLAKSEYKREYWEYIEQNLSSFVNSDDDENCLKILQLSYNQLPVYLKSCFLYMGVFEEDSEIRISSLIKLWVAEGFVKPIHGKDLEEVAKECLDNLMVRNLIFIVESNRKCVKIHDLLRDLCLRQAEAERFYTAITRYDVSIPLDQRRFIVSEALLEEEVCDTALQSMSLARSLIYPFKRAYPLPHLNLLRISSDALSIDDDYYSPENKFPLVNLRLLYARCPSDSKFASSLHLLWNLKTLIIAVDFGEGFIAPAEIWNMRQLRHVEVAGYLSLRDPPICDEQDCVVLENLHTLTLVRNLKCSEEEVKRIPNVKKLCVKYLDGEVEESCLDNLDGLHKLESFYCTSYECPKLDRPGSLQKISVPLSLKKLTLAGYVHWEEMLEKIGSLPLLQKLKISNGFFTTHKWETVEGQFPSLKFLKMNHCNGLEYWNSECSHFPRLEHIVLWGLDVLNEIPLGIGEIPTLQSIQLYNCCGSIIMSCKRIQEEYEALYGEEGLRVQVLPEK